ncbi:hypothetical protein ACFPES_03515 [Paenibacillus sp. GCM10023248]|nr:MULTISPECIES: hypothetical protein [Bacillales]MDD9266094.1 hypothetical protein [Paenibacillus sp. MAHUQ-63]MDR6878270.1 RNA:NAD 2'-phosphotransferase (TPT1/KptA family) [Bacillus sp. 3255]
MLTNKERTALSKLMSKILRHSPEPFGVQLHPADGSCQRKYSSLLRLN